MKCGRSLIFALVSLLFILSSCKRTLVIDDNAIEINKLTGSAKSFYEGNDQTVFRTFILDGNSHFIIAEEDKLAYLGRYLDRIRYYEENGTYKHVILPYEKQFAGPDDVSLVYERNLSTQKVSSVDNDLQTKLNMSIDEMIVKLGKLKPLTEDRKAEIKASVSARFKGVFRKTRSVKTDVFLYQVRTELLDKIKKGHEDQKELISEIEMKKKSFITKILIARVSSGYTKDSGIVTELAAEWKAVLGEHGLDAGDAFNMELKSHCEKISQPHYIMLGYGVDITDSIENACLEDPEHFASSLFPIVKIPGIRSLVGGGTKSLEDKKDMSGEENEEGLIGSPAEEEIMMNTDAINRILENKKISTEDLIRSLE